MANVLRAKSMTCWPVAVTTASMTGGNTTDTQKVSTAPMIDSATAHAVGRIALDRVTESGATLGLAGRCACIRTVDAGGRDQRRRSAEAPPLISVILNTYNRAALLPRAVESVLAQTHDDFELVVVDDGSSDRTPGVVAAFEDPRVRYVRQHNAGLSAARNFGVASSSERYVTFLNDDDEVLPGWLEAFAAAISSSGCGVACCGAEAVDANHTVIELYSPATSGHHSTTASACFTRAALPCRDVFDAIGGYAADLPCHHQTEFALRLVSPRDPNRHRPVHDDGAARTGRGQ